MPTPTKHLTAVPLIAIVLAVLTVPASASATTAPEALAFLNEQRAAAGIPGDLTENTTLDEGCALHDAYMEANGYEGDAHVEEPGKPGYTTLGAEAGGLSDLDATSASTGFSDKWSETENPWLSRDEYAPLHFAHLFDPTATEAWYAEDTHYACLGVAPRMAAAGTAPTSPAFYSYPGNGQSGIPYAVEALELPMTPAEAVGLQGVTGPNLIFYLLDAAVTWQSEPSVIGATLTGPSGAVEARTVTPTTAIKGFGSETSPFSNYDPGTAIMIPVAPLAPNTTYTATLTWELQGQQLTQTTTFTTGDEQIPTPRPTGTEGEEEAESTSKEHAQKTARHTRLRARLTRRGVLVTSTSPAAIYATFRRLPARRVIKYGLMRRGATWKPRLTRGKYEACFTQNAKSGYTQAEKCVRVSIPLQTPRQHSNKR